MAKLLVCAVDQDGPLRYKQGDIVVVYPDSYQFSAGEGPPTFWQITVTSLLDGDNPTLTESVNESVFVVPVMMRRRKRFVDITQLSQLAQNNLASTGRATVLRLALLGALTLRA